MPEFTNKKRFDCMQFDDKNVDKIIKRIRLYYTVTKYIDIGYLIIITVAKTIILQQGDWVICSYKDHIDTRNNNIFQNEFNQVITEK